MASLGIGSVLKEERLRQNLHRDEISRLTCIAPRFIEAIEQDDFSSLPGIVFARSFVRQYCQVLGLDPAPLLAALPKPDIESAPLPVPQPGQGRRRWDPGIRRWDPRIKSAMQTALFVAAAIGAGILAWARFNSGAEHGSYFSFHNWRVREVKVSAQQTVPAAAPAPVPEALPATQPVPVGVQEVAAPLKVTVAAHEASWVQITADGKSLFSGILNPGGVQTAGASGRVKVLAGNAGGVDISLNGKKLDPLGAAGQVRSVTLTSDGPLPDEQTQPSVAAQPPSPDRL